MPIAAVTVPATTTEVVRLALGQGLDHYSPKAVRLAKMGVADFMAVTLAATSDPLARTSAEMFHVGTEARQSGCADELDIDGVAGEAAHLGFLAHLLDLDDMGNAIRGHPTGPVMAAGLPLAARLGSSGTELLAAYMTAVDGMYIAGRSVATAVQQRGLHPTAVLGALGSALVCSRLLGLAEDQTAGAASLALAQTAGSLANFGTPAKPMQVGLAAAGGARAALMAQRGIMGGPTPVEALQSLSHSDVPSFRVEYEVSSESGWEVGDARFKRFSSCALTHQSITAAQSLREQCSPDQIEKVDVKGSYRVASMLKYPVPTDRHEAKFSLPYCLALGLIHGRPLLPTMLAGRLDEDALELARRVEFQIHPDLNHVGVIDREYTEVSVRLKSGEKLDAVVNGLVQLESEEELIEKLRTCFAHVRLGHEADDWWARIISLETATNVTALQELLVQLPGRN